jgi:chemotaxis-related protein WspD
MTAPDVDACWTRIGIAGDGSCAELRRVVHCRNCEVYAHAGRQLLDQCPPPGYLEQWATQLAAVEAETDIATLSVVIFRLGAEYFALPAAAFVEVVEVRAAHRIPHRANDTLLGLVNIGGELQLCVSLAALLGTEPAGSADTGGRPRLAVIERAADRWVFPVDELLAIERIAQRALSAPPATIARDATALTTALFTWRDTTIALLDADLLFAALDKVVA